MLKFKKEDGPKYVVYIIDEARAVRTFVKNALAQMNVDIIEFDSGANGFAALTSGEEPFPHLVVFEARLRDIDSLSVLKRLRKQETTKHLPMMVFANASDKRTVLSFLRSGADEYLVKPSDPKTFQQKVELLAGNSGLMNNIDPHKNVVLAESNSSSALQMRLSLQDAGYTPLYAANGSACLRMWRREIRLGVISSTLPDISGAMLSESIRGKYSSSRIILVSDPGDETLAAKARQAGASMYLTRPVDFQGLREKLEEVMEFSPPLEEIEIEKQYEARLHNSNRPFPPAVQGVLRLSLKHLAELFEQDPDFDKKQLLMSDQSLWLIDSNEDSGIRDRDAVILEGRAVRKSSVEAVMRGIAKGLKVVDISERETSRLSVMATYDLGHYLYGKSCPSGDALKNELMLSPVGKVLLTKGSETEIAEALTRVDVALGFLDAYFIYHLLRYSGFKEYARHLLVSSFIAVLLARRAIGKDAKISSKRRITLEAMCALGVFLSHLGLCSSEMPLPDGEDFYRMVGDMPGIGADLISRAKTFECAKVLIRDFIVAQGQWCSRFDSCSHIIGVALRFSALTTAGAILPENGTARVFPESFSYGEACLEMKDSFSSESPVAPYYNILFELLGCENFPEVPITV